MRHCVALVLLVLLAACAEENSPPDSPTATVQGEEHDSSIEAEGEDSETSPPEGRSGDIAESGVDVEDTSDGEIDESSEETNTSEEEQERTTWPYADSYAAGVHLIEEPIETPSGRILNWMIWYPVAPGDTEGLEPYNYLSLLEGTAFKEAPVASGGPWPLLVFSHGNQGIKEQSYFFTEHLAKMGFVVASPDHQWNTALDYDSDQTPLIALERPADVSAVIDRILDPLPSDPEWLAGAIMEDRIAVAGHSFGGYTTMMAGGTHAVIPQELLDDCEVDPGDFYCSLVGELGTDPIDLGDARIGAGIAMAPAGYALFGDEGLAQHDIPTLVIGGTLDDTTTMEGDIIPIYEGIPGPKALLTVEGGDHFTFSDLCSIPGIDSLTEFGDFAYFCGPDNPLPHAVVHPFVNTLSTAFLRVWLMGEEDEDGILTPGWAKDAHPSLTLETQEETP